MNVTKNQIDDLNASLQITIAQEDFRPGIETQLQAYRKQAKEPGFRKGHVPMAMIKKKHESGLVFEEVNKLIQSSLNDFLNKEKIAILGNPLPIENTEIDWTAKELNFDFELGLAPKIKVDLKKIKVATYDLKIDEKQIDSQVENIRNRFGDVRNLDEVEAGTNLTVALVQLDAEGKEEKGGVFNPSSAISFDKLSKVGKETFKGKKVGETVRLASSDLFVADTDLSFLLGKTIDESKALAAALSIEIKQISKTTPAEVNQALFDKAYGEGVLKSEKEFRDKITEESSQMYGAEVDRFFMNAVIEKLIEETKFDLPKKFLVKWILQSNEKATNVEEAEAEYEKSEKGLRYQLIEAKVAEEYSLKVEQEEVLVEARKMIDQQLKIYGQVGLEEDQVQQIVQNALANQDEYQRIASQVFSAKMMKVLKENVTSQVEEVTFDEFLKKITEKK